MSYSGDRIVQHIVVAALVFAGLALAQEQHLRVFGALLVPRWMELKHLAGVAVGCALVGGWFWSR